MVSFQLHFLFLVFLIDGQNTLVLFTRTVKEIRSHRTANLKAFVHFANNKTTPAQCHLVPHLQNVSSGVEC